MGDKAETGVPLNKGRKMTMLMEEFPGQSKLTFLE